MYDTILVATDGSTAANRATTHALEQAEQHEAALHAIFVVDTNRHSEPALSSTELKTIEVEDWANEELGKVVDRGERLDIAVTTRCCHGRPYREIINYADEIDADLIVLGYHGHSHMDTDHIGSVADRVVRNAGRPVLVAT